MFLYINSPGGSVTSGISVYDAMNYVQAGVTTICVGIAASMASFILAGGDRGSRIALPHCRVMIHQPNSGSRGQASDVTSEATEVLRFRKLIGEIYVKRTGQNLITIARDLDRDFFMSAHEAKEYGIVDQVAASTQYGKY